jgi:polysaccharide transporter, PST family
LARLKTMNQAWARFLPPFLRAHVEGSLPLQRSIANSGWLFFDHIARVGVGFFVGVWIARYLGPSQLGILDYSIAFVYLFSALASLGLNGIVVRELVREPERREETLASAFAMLALAGVISLLLVVVSIVLLRPGDTLVQLLVVLVAVGMIFQSFSVIEFWFKSQVQSKFSVYARNAAFLIVSLVKVFLILSGAPLVWFALAGLAEIALGAFLLLLVFRFRGYRLHLGRASISRCKELLRDSWPAAISCLSIALFLKIDMVMLGEMTGSEAVGIYSAASRISVVWYFLPSVIVSSVFPFIIQARAVDSELYLRRVAQLFSLMTALALSVIIMIVVSADALVDLLYGAPYAAAGPVLAIHILGCWFVFLGQAQEPWDVAENLMRLAMFRTVSGALINILLNLVLIPHYAAVGAAVASVVSLFFAGVLLNLVSKRTRTIFNLQLKSLLFLRYLRQ